MTKQPVIGTIVIGILVVLQSLWILALALEWAVVTDISPTQVLVFTLIGLAIVLIIAALWPRSARKAEPLRFSPVTEELAAAGIRSRQEDIVADLSWLDPSSPITIPIYTTGTATIITSSQDVAIRSENTMDIDANMNISWAKMDGKKNVYIGPGITGVDDALMIVDVTAKDVKVTNN